MNVLTDPQNKEDHPKGKSVSNTCDHSQEFGSLITYLDSKIKKSWYLLEKDSLNLAPLPIIAIKDKAKVVNLNSPSLIYYGFAQNEIKNGTAKKRRTIQPLSLQDDTQNKEITVRTLLWRLEHKVYKENNSFVETRNYYSNLYDRLMNDTDFSIDSKGLALPAYIHSPLSSDDQSKNHFRDIKRLANIVLMPSEEYKNSIIYMFILTTPISSDTVLNLYESICKDSDLKVNCRIRNQYKQT
jgi:hypothetical protein